LNPGQPSLSAARRYLFVWVGVALIPIGLAAYLTKEIVFVTRVSFDYQKMPVEEIGIFIFPAKSISNNRPTANYSYDERSKESFVELLSDASSAKIVLNHIPGPDACVDMGSPNKDGLAVPLKLFPVHLTGEPFVDTYLIDWEFPSGGEIWFPHTNSPLHEQIHNMWIKCRLKSIMARSTYTERYIYFRGIGSEMRFKTPQDSPLGYSNNPKPYGPFGEPQKLTLDLTQVASAKDIFREAVSARWKRHARQPSRRPE
jgi:hypothetical protein